MYVIVVYAFIKKSALEMALLILRILWIHIRLTKSICVINTLITILIKYLIYKFVFFYFIFYAIYIKKKL